ncbi:Transposon Tn7 transposition protein TnsE [Halomonadaceae bacterium LMG 33818]|uniref:Tn7-like element transposition protein TnsE n=1 Tax=Cernens ardua TaxID=3402176 RepID=UPI003EDB8C14
MSKITFRDIPYPAQLLGIGNIFRSSRPHAQSWRIAALFEDRYDKRSMEKFDIEAASVLGVGRTFTGDGNTPYQSKRGFHEIVLPHVHSWGENDLGNFPDLWWGLAKRGEIASQRCFVFQVGELTVWLPKFELARKLFFHAGFLTRAALVSNGLDMLFNIEEREDEATLHIHTLARTGVPLKNMLHQAYQRHFSWLLLEPEVRRSFESIWEHLNKEVQQSESRYERWNFNFLPPANIHGTKITVSGRLSKDEKSILVGEICSLSGLKITNQRDVVFHHPSHKAPIRGNASPGNSVGNAENMDIEVDINHEPSDGNAPELIELPDESISFDSHISTRMAYAGERAAGYGRKTDDDGLAGGDGSSRVLGIGEPVMDGTNSAGELQQLGKDEISRELLRNRFALLYETIKQIGEDPRLQLVSIEARPLPAVGRCSFHMINADTPRCCLVARFRLRDGREKYLLELDMSDGKKAMSTSIIDFGLGTKVEKLLNKILEQTVKKSRWPKLFLNMYMTFDSVHHFKEGTGAENAGRLSIWQNRLKKIILL